MRGCPGSWWWPGAGPALSRPLLLSTPGPSLSVPLPAPCSHHLAANTNLKCNRIKLLELPSSGSQWLLWAEWVVPVNRRDQSVLRGVENWVVKTKAWFSAKLIKLVHVPISLRYWYQYHEKGTKRTSVIVKGLKVFISEISITRSHLSTVSFSLWLYSFLNRWHLRWNPRCWRCHL